MPPVGPISESENNAIYWTNIRVRYSSWPLWRTMLRTGQISESDILADPCGEQCHLFAISESESNATYWTNMYHGVWYSTWPLWRSILLLGKTSKSDIPQYLTIVENCATYWTNIRFWYSTWPLWRTMPSIAQISEFSILPDHCGKWWQISESDILLDQFGKQCIQLEKYQYQKI